jgi:hypothetical protein
MWEEGKREMKECQSNKKVRSMKKDKKREGLIERLKTSCGKCIT